MQDPGLVTFENKSQTKPKKINMILVQYHTQRYSSTAVSHSRACVFILVHTRKMCSCSYSYSARARGAATVTGCSLFLKLYSYEVFGMLVNSYNALNLIKHTMDGIIFKIQILLRTQIQAEDPKTNKYIQRDLAEITILVPGLHTRYRSTLQQIDLPGAYSRTPRHELAVQGSCLLLTWQTLGSTTVVSGGPRVYIVKQHAIAYLVGSNASKRQGKVLCWDCRSGNTTILKSYSMLYLPNISLSIITEKLENVV